MTSPQTLAGASVVAAMLVWTIDTHLPDDNEREVEDHVR
jgi:hypothetical protein